MPRGRRQLNKEELEVQEILSPNKGSSRQASGVSNIIIRTNTGNPSNPSSIQVHRPDLHVADGPTINTERPKAKVVRHQPKVDRPQVKFDRTVNMDRSPVERPEVHSEQPPVEPNQSAANVPRFAVSDLFSFFKGFCCCWY